MSFNYENKNKITALILCLFFGYLGVHRFYLRNFKMGVLYLFTMGLFGFGWIIDLIILIKDVIADNSKKPFTSPAEQTNTTTPIQICNPRSPLDYLPQWEHKSSKQLERQNRAVALSDRVINIHYKTQQMEIQRDKGDGYYTATLQGCTCEDFTYRRQPCKHMYCLAFALFKNNAGLAVDYVPAPAKIGSVHSKLLQNDELDKNSFSRFIAFDTETSGLSSNDRIIEIGAVVFESGAPVSRFSSLINPHVLTQPDAEKANHISQAMIDSAPPEESVIPDFLSFLGDAAHGKTCIVAHNARFDRMMLVETLKRLGYDANLIFFDTLSFARNKLPSLPNHQLGTVANYFHIVNPSAHRALEDAETCGYVFLSLLNHIQ